MKRRESHWLTWITDSVRPIRSGSRAAQPGQVLVIFALSIFVLIGFVALAVDAGYLMAQRRQAQSAADGAAMAAAKAYQRNEIANIQSAGSSYAIANEFTAGEVSIEQHATYTSTANGSYVKCVRATITHDADQFFVGVIYSGPWQVTAVGVACSDPEPREYALQATDPDGDGIKAGGASDLTITGEGGAMSNADIDLCGSASWIQVDGPLDAYNGIDICNNANVVSDAPNPRAEMVPDPFAPPNLAEPNCSGYGPSQTFPQATYQNPPLDQRWDPANPSDPWVPDVRLGTGPGTGDEGPRQRFKPGKYPDGISISKSFDVFFEPGLYCIGGNGLKLTTNTGTLDVLGEDVMLYFYGSNSMLDINSQNVNAEFANDGSGTCTQAACAAKIVVFYGRPATCDDLRLNGNVVTLTGVLYAPCSEIILAGNGNLTVTGQVIGGEISVAGGNQVVINYESDLEITPSQVRLVD